MKKYLFLIQALILILIISACDTSSDYYQQENLDPQILVKGPYDNDFGRKTLDSTKFDRGDYVLFYKILDEEELTLTITHDPAFTVQLDKEKIIVSATERCRGELKLNTEDTFGASDEMKILLTFFGNLPPVAILEIEDVPGFYYEKKIDASKSYDPDEKYGGKIVLYRFLINGKEIQKEYHPFMYYTFPRTGNYDVRIQVMDDEEEWSTQVYKRLEFN